MAFDPAVDLVEDRSQTHVGLERAEHGGPRI
jgi:hypothetical protein